jgi:DNA-directed RNA polymerase sigma subunit (sigma70/sigma32)
LDEIGAALGLTREGIREIERDALAWLRANRDVVELREYLADLG